ncbi:hypothetical protein [Devosia sp.]|uniref:hypothetical protein n=1 Tax=Devosia sp. TaxID=1871048 RepID=UPI003266AC0E
MRQRFVLGLLYLALLGGLGLFFSGSLPRFGGEDRFQNAIRTADLSNRQLGWTKRDVTEKICNDFDADALDKAGSEKTNNSGVQGWMLMEEKGIFAACWDHTQRYLRVYINTATNACKATVGLMPVCDP